MCFHVFFGFFRFFLKCPNFPLSMGKRILRIIRVNKVFWLQSRWKMQSEKMYNVFILQNKFTCSVIVFPENIIAWMEFYDVKSLRSFPSKSPESRWFVSEVFEQKSESWMAVLRGRKMAREWRMKRLKKKRLKGVWGKQTEILAVESGVELSFRSVNRLKIWKKAGLEERDAWRC